MEDPAQWTEADLERLIMDGVKESLTLDYKASPALGRDDPKKNELNLEPVAVVG